MAFDPKDLNAVEQRQVNSFKRAISDVSNKFKGVRAKINEIAPGIMKLFDNLKARHGVDFVSFVRLYAPDLPTHAADKDGVTGYRKHPVYYSLDYMRRLTNLQTAAGKPRGRQGVRDVATDALARSLATILQIVKDPGPVWAAVQDQFKMSQRLVTGLQNRVKETKPLLDLSDVMKPIKITSENVVKMVSTKGASEAAAETTGKMRDARAALGQPGQRVRIAGRRKQAAA